jgi:hypothetical protein
MADVSTAVEMDPTMFQPAVTAIESEFRAEPVMEFVSAAGNFPQNPGPFGIVYRCS